MNGPFGNGFPYTNFHELNMDWIIRIAKDFLDQYTHIQDIISSGETSLQNTTAVGIESLQAEKTRLEGLLDAWYTTHSEDIAGELASAISDFRTAAAAIGAEVIASIPGDYTALTAKVNNMQSDLEGSYAEGIYAYTGAKPLMIENNCYYTTPAVGEVSEYTSHANWLGLKAPIKEGERVVARTSATADNIRAIAFLNSSNEVLWRYDKVNFYTLARTAPANSAYVVVNFMKSKITLSEIFAYIGENIKMKVDNIVEDFNKSINIQYPTISLGNFAGSNIWDDLSDVTNVAKTVILENFGNCTIRSTIKGIRLTIFTADEEGSAESGSSSLLDQQYDVLYINGTYNYARIRIQPGTSGITDFTNYLSRLIQFEYPVGIANRLSNAEKNINIMQYNPKPILDLRNVTLTENTTYTITVPTFNPSNIVAKFDAKYTGSAANDYLRPRIYAQSGFGAYSTSMFIGGKGSYQLGTVRLLPLRVETALTLQIVIAVPSGLTLSIKHLQIAFDENITRAKPSINIDGHTGFRVSPPYSKRATDLIAQLGAYRCITIPKRSSDGVWFCYHDDTFDISNTFLRNDDGTVIESSEYNGLPFSQIPFSYLNGLDWGVSTNAAFAGEKAQLVSDFFKTCAKTGMHPVLSFHPAAQSTAENFAEIKAMAKKYGVLDKLTIKAPAASNTVTALQTAFSVFGYEIEGYTANVVSGGNVGTVITNFTALDIDETKVICCIEQFAGSNTLIDESITNILSAGFEAGIASASHTSMDGLTGTELTQTDYEYYSNLGVNYFTSSAFASYGLNW